MKKLLLVALIAFSIGDVFAQCGQFPVLDLGPDTLLCPNQSLTLGVPQGFDYSSWNIGQGNQPSVTINTPTTVVLNVANYTGNLVVNGDFESGYSGFTSDYMVGSGGTWGQLSNSSTYAITTSPNLVHSNFVSCADVGTGTPGNMMVVNGSTIPNTIVWEQTINVVANTDYNFSVWVTSVENINSSNVSSLQFYINNVQLGNVFSPTLNGCDWQQFTQTWNSAIATSATISIVAQVSSGNNDFAIDNITFNSACLQSDTLVVSFDSSTIDAGQDIAFCENEPETVTATVNYPNPNFVWETNETTATIQPQNSGWYTVSSLSPNGCIIQDSVNVAITSMPWDFDTIVSEPTNCGANNGVVYVLMQGNFIGQPVYTWTGPGANNPNSINASVWQNLSTGWYYIDVQNQGCHRSDSIYVEPLNPPVAGVTANPISGTYPLTVDFTNSSQNGTTYLWNFGNGNSAVENDLSGQQQVYDTTGVYLVQLIAQQGNCTDTAYVTITVNNPPPPLVYVPVDIQSPNIFTPNGDQVNDFFEFKLLNIQEIHTVIVNRWGNIMFESNENPVKWDGKDADEGMYFYTYKAKGAQGESLKGHGFIQLIR